MENFNFLHQIKNMIDLYEQQKEISGENFNIFSIMSMESDEVFTHSALLGELLSPIGSHGLGDDPLKAFYKVVLNKEIALNTKTVHCLKEENIGKISDDKSEGGRLDIVVKDNNEEGFVIENKIYALEQINQLGRYQNRYPKAELLYLTLDGKDSGQNNLESEKFYKSISYKEDIKNWLEECLKLAYDKPIVRETLKQYLFLIKKLTHQTQNIEMSKKIVDIVKENFEASAEIFNNFEIALREKQFLFLEVILSKLETELMKEDLKGVSAALENLVNIDFLEIKVANDFRVQLRIKNLTNPLILIGADKQNKEKLYDLLKDLRYRKVDWTTNEWQLWQHNWEGLGRNFKVINNIDIIKINEIVSFLMKTIVKLTNFNAK